MNSDIDRYLVSPAKSIRDVMANLTHSRGFAVVVDSNRCLLGTVTDGDIRRAIMANIDLSEPVDILLRLAKPPDRPVALTALLGTSDSVLMQLMTDAEVRNIPIIDEAGVVHGVADLEELIQDFELPITALVMAGGLGTRLRPLTDDIPKPMLPVDGRPLLEHIIGGLREANIRNVSISTRYKADVIKGHFGDGTDFGIDIQYVNEKEPLGTAGALSMVDINEKPMLVINGDIVTKLDLRSIVNYHMEHRADITVAIRSHQYTVPFGVVDINGPDITGIDEKPTHKFTINAGIYLIGSKSAAMVPIDTHYDMTDLISDSIESGLKVVGFPVEEYWIDVSQIADYEKVRTDFGEV